MNAAQAKRIPLETLLARLGHTPHRRAKGELWYASPFRREERPSFKINPERNVWYDFGAGTGGNVLDFALTYYRLTTVREALRALDRLDQDPLPPITGPPVALAPPLADPVTAAPPADVRLMPLVHPALLAYLDRRGIGGVLARPHVRELHYRRDGKPYFALAFPNAAGGYELRNPHFKGTHGPKDITVIERGGGGCPGGDAALFEGFMDFLSALACGVLADGTTAVVLNSAALRARAARWLAERGPTAVHLYLDHDAAGRELTTYFSTHLPSLAVSDRSSRYVGYKDFNEYVAARRTRSDIETIANQHH